MKSALVDDQLASAFKESQLSIIAEVPREYFAPNDSSDHAKRLVPSKHEKGSAKRSSMAEIPQPPLRE